MPGGTSSQVTDMFREPSSPASMRMLVRSPCHSSVGASARRLTSTSRFLPDPGPGRCERGVLADDEVDQLAGNDDLLGHLFAVQVALDVLAALGQLDQLLLRGVGADL